MKPKMENDSNRQPEKRCSTYHIFRVLVMVELNDGIINDFDMSCSIDDGTELSNVQIGTSAYRSPYLRNVWRARDD